MFFADIAGCSLALHSDNDALWAARMMPFAAAGTTVPDCTVSVTCSDSVPPPDGVPCGRKKTVSWMRLPDGTFAVCSESRRTDTRETLVFDEAFSRVSISLCRSFPSRELSVSDREYMYVSQSFGNHLLAHGGCILHSSAVSVGGRCFAFAGRSGAGKTTHTALWKQALGGDCVILNDDTPALRFDAAVPTVYGTPFSGTSAEFQNQSAPLAAIVFVEKAAENRIVRLTGNDALFRLREALPLPYYAPETAAAGLDRMAEIVSAVPLFLLSCDRSEAAFQTSYHALMEDLL